MTDGDVRAFLVPDLGEGLEDATVVCWNVAVGDIIELNQALCSLETAKAEVEIPSPYAGRVVELRGDEGETLLVGSVLARIDVEPGSVEPSDGTPADGRYGGHGNGSGNGHGSGNGSGSGSGNGNGNGNGNGKGTAVLVGYGTDSSIDSTRRSRVPGGRSGRPRAAPPVRKLAAELLVDLESLQPGSGPDGLITRADVLAAAAGPAPEREATHGPGYEVIPVTRVHARMATRMAQSRSEIPDSHSNVQVDCTNLLKLRDQFRASATESSPSITWFVLLLRLLVVALSHNKIFNSTWVDTPNGPQVRTHNPIHLGFGVATPRGLVVPVVTDAQSKSTLELAIRVNELIRGAREGSLKPVELQGSTFTVSNFGALGIDQGVPVINYPEAAILGVGSLKERAVVVDGEVAVRPTMTLTCAFDHRIADGAQLASLLCELRDLIQSPELALLDL